MVLHYGTSFLQRRWARFSSSQGEDLVGHNARWLWTRHLLRHSPLQPAALFMFTAVSILKKKKKIRWNIVSWDLRTGVPRRSGENENCNNLMLGCFPKIGRRSILFALLCNKKTMFAMNARIFTHQKIYVPVRNVGFWENIETKRRLLFAKSWPRSVFYRKTCFWDSVFFPFSLPKRVRLRNERVDTSTKCFWHSKIIAMNMTRGKGKRSAVVSGRQRHRYMY